MGVVLWNKVSGQKIVAHYDNRQEAVEDLWQGDEDCVIEYPNGMRETVVPPAGEFEVHQLDSVSVEVFDGEEWVEQGSYRNTRHAQPHYWDFADVLGHDRVRVVERKNIDRVQE